MIRPIILAALVSASPVLAQPAPAAPSPPAGQDTAAPLSLEQRMLVRCSAAFALVAHRQAAGDASALAYPPLQERGQEFFVRASVRVIDETGMDRSAVAQALTAEATALNEGKALEQVMPACLSALEAAGL